MRNVNEYLFRRTIYFPASKCRVAKWAFLWLFFDEFLPFWIFFLPQKPGRSNHKISTELVSECKNDSIFKFW